MKNNIVQFDTSLISRYRGALMGIAILNVLVLHGMKWAAISNPYIIKTGEIFGKLLFTEGFLFLSGFGLFYSLTKTQELRAFYKKRVERLLIPFALMIFPFLLPSLISGDLSVGDFLLKETSLYYWKGGNYSGMWYIAISVILYALSPFFFRLINRKDPRLSIVNGILLISIAIIGCELLRENNPSYFKLVYLAIPKIPIFIIGMMVAYSSVNNKKIHVLTIGGVF